MFRRIPVAIAVVLIAGCSTFIGRPQTPPPKPVHTDYRTVRDVVISPPGWPERLKADLYLPRSKDPHPAVLLIFGGGWHHGDRTQLAPIAINLASRGYVAVATSYRLAPRYRFPAQLRDVQLAVRWMRANATTYGIDPKRIGAWGYSAGAHLAALLGGINASDKLGWPGSEIEAVVAGGTPTDLTKPTKGRQVIELIGGTIEQKAAEYIEASPIHYVSPGDPPVFIYHGGADRLVSLDHATDYKARLDAAGIPNELMILRGRNHLMAYLTDQPAVDEGLHFLDRYLRDAH
jgi:acetyl esterase/lipase